jgi:hypothetical protein
LTYRCRVDIFTPYGAAYRTRLINSPRAKEHLRILGEAMKLVYVCYAALGYAVARWIFQRQPIPITDPVTRFRSSGLL